MMNLLIVISLSMMGFMATFLVLDKKYEDGLIGRLALVGMILSSFLISTMYVEHLASGADWRSTGAPKLLFVVFMVSMMLFMGRHLYRYLRWRICGDGAWRGKGK
jgi:ABC-type uncharacterized transport system permease subunit